MSFHDSQLFSSSPRSHNRPIFIFTTQTFNLTKTFHSNLTPEIKRWFTKIATSVKSKFWCTMYRLINQQLKTNFVSNYVLHNFVGCFWTVDMVTCWSRVLDKSCFVSDHVPNLESWCGCGCVKQFCVLHYLKRIRCVYFMIIFWNRIEIISI